MAESDDARASDAERSTTIERLGEAVAQGRLTLDEFSKRSADVYGSTTRGELETVVRDLPVSRSAPAVAPSQPLKARRRWHTAVFGDSTIEGHWQADGTLVPVSVFGDVEVDLRHASVTSNRIDITASSPFGNVDVLVPAGVRVEATGFTLFGSKRISTSEPAGVNSPVVHIRAFSLFGSIRVRSV